MRHPFARLVDCLILALVLQGIAPLPARAAAVGQVTLTISPQQTIADANSKLRVQVVVVDGSGQAMAQQPLSITASGSGARLSVSSGTTDNAGHFVTFVNAAKAGTKLITASAGGISDSVPVRFVAAAPVSTSSQMSVSPLRPQIADGITPFYFSAAFRDAYANPVAGANVTVASPSPTTSFSPSQGVTGADGSFLTALTSRRAGPTAVTLSAGAASQTLIVQYIGGEPNSALSSMAISPNGPVRADNLDAYTVRISLVDDANNPVSGYPVSMGGRGSAGVFYPPDGVTDGMGQFKTLLRSRFVGSQSVIFAAGALTGTQMRSFVVGEPKSITTTLTANPARLVADGNARTTLTATVRDASGNLVPDAAFTFLVTGSQNVLSTTACLTDAQGSCTTELSSSRAETKSISLFAPNFVARGNVQFVAGNANAQASTVVPNTQLIVVANGASPLKMTATVVDAYANPVANQAVSWSSSVPSDVLSPTSVFTNGLGVAYTVVTATRVGSRQITARAGALALTGNVTFGPGPIFPNTSSLVLSPAGGAVADAVDAVRVTATLRDAQNRPLPGLSVSVTSSGSGNVFDGAGAKATLVADANGVVTTMMRSTRAEAKSLTLKGGSGTLLGNTRFIAGEPVLAGSTLTLLPTRPVVAQATGLTMQVRTLDAFGNTCAGVPVSLSATGSSNQFVAAQGNTTSLGQYSTVLASTVAEGKTITAQLPGFSLSQNILFGPAAPSADNTTLAVDVPSGTPADGQSPVTVTATVRDAFGNLVNNQSVSLTVAGSQFILSKKYGTTGAPGTLVSQLLAKAAGTATVVMQAGLVRKTVTVSFSSAAPVALNRIAPQQNDDNDFVQLVLAHLDGGAQTHAVSLNARARALDVYAPGSNGYTPIQAVEVDGRAQNLIRADVDGDGVDDMILTYPEAQSLAVLLGTGDGTLAAPSPYALAAAPDLIAAADFDGNGSSEWVTYSRATGDLALGCARGLGTQTIAHPFANLAQARALAAGDINGDGLADIIAASGAGITTYLGRGDQTFAGGAHTPLADAATLLAADFDGDGRADLAVINAAGDALTCLHALAEGGFEVLTEPLPRSAWRLVGASDVNGDGLADIVLLDEQGALWVAHTRPEGGFAPAQALSATSATMASAAVDESARVEGSLVAIDDGGAMFSLCSRGLRAVP